MRKRFLPVFLALSALLLAVPGTTGAQPPAPWEITLFDPGSGSVTLVTSGGIFQQAIFPNIPSLGSNVWRAQITPDGHYLVFNTYQDTGGQNIYVADLQTQTCCRQLDDPLNAGLDVDWLGPISPDGTQVVVSSSSTSIFTGNGEINFIPLVTVFDIATGNVLNAMAVADLVADYPAPIAQFGDWKADGIRLVAGCMACEGVWQGSWQIWDPDTNTLSAPLEPFDVNRAELPATGEFVMGTENSAFPVSGAFQAYFPPANVVEYYGNASANPQVIYHRSTDPYIVRSAWIADGQAILVIHAGPFEMDPNGFPMPGANGPAFVIFRDGTQVPVPDPFTSRGFLTGTPDGWLAQDWDTGQITYYQLDANRALQGVLLGTAPGIVVGQNFTLGASASGIFPTVSPPTPVACAGFMNSRLTPNSLGLVTPGAANNMRANPSANAALIGEIPGSEVFIVLDGPVCAENMAWWQVNYKGLIGWTAEGQGTDYWLQPNAGGF